MTQTERIIHMEHIYDKCTEAVKQLERAIACFNAQQSDIAELEAYYSSKWRADFSADELGKLPQNLKRGVLSEDGLWNLLEDYARLKKMTGQ